MNNMQLLVRFDDLCPTMNWNMWNEIEKICIDNRIKPIVAVIPDNKDVNFFINDPREDFWDHIGELQKMGWTVGLHGYQHVYVNNYSGMLGITTASEFSELNYKEQEEKIRKGIEIFKLHNIHPDMWIAPAHSFDNNTLKALRNFNITVISDGFFTRPVMFKEFTWIPSQLWDRVVPHNSGVWTICNHFNHWNIEDLKHFEHYIIKYKDKYISVNNIINEEVSPANIYDIICLIYKISAIRLKRIIKKAIGRK